MDDDDDRRLLDIIGDVQALNDYLHGSNSKSIDEDDLNSATFGSANSLFASASNADPSSTLKDVSNHLGNTGGDGLQLSSSLQFIEEELGGASPSMGELGEEQPFDILQKSLQEADITEQTLAQEALLESSSPSLGVAGQPFSQQVVPNSSFGAMGLSHLPVLQPPAGSHFPGMQPHGFIHQVHPQHLHNGSPSGHIQLVGSFNTQPPMMTINNLDRPQILLKPGQPSSPGMGGGLLVQRQPSHNAGGGPMFSNSAPGQVSMPFKGCGLQAPIPVQNIIIQRGPSSQPLSTMNQNLKGPISIQPKPIQVGHQTVYNISSLGIQPPPSQHQAQQSSPYASANSPQAGQQQSQQSQQMTLNIVNQPGLRKPTSGHQVINHSGSIVIQSPMGAQHQQQSSLHQNQFLLPTSLSISPSCTATHSIQALNGQVLQTQQAQLIHNPADQAFGNRTLANPSYSGAILANQSTSVQLVAGQNFASSGGQLIVNQGVVSSQLQQPPQTVVHLSASHGNVPKARPGFPAGGQAGSSMVQGMQIPNRFAVINSAGSVHPGYGAQSQQAVQGASAQQNLQQQQAPVRQQVPANMGHRFFPPASEEAVNSSQTLGNQGAQHQQVQQQQHQQCETHQFGQNQTQKEAGLFPKLQDGLRQPQLANLLVNKGLSAASAPLDNVHLANKAEVQHLHQPNTQISAHKRPASQQLTKGNLILQQLRKDQASVQAVDKSPFSSVDDAIKRLLPYHVFQGSLPTDEDFKRVDNEFEAVATQVLKRTQAMLNKYRRLLLVEGKRMSPSSEMVMIDRTFNQEERANLTQDKRLALMDPDGFLEDFCCLAKPTEQAAQEALASQTPSPPNRTEKEGASSPRLTGGPQDTETKTGAPGSEQKQLCGDGVDTRKASLTPSTLLQCQSGCSPAQDRREDTKCKGTLDSAVRKASQPSPSSQSCKDSMGDPPQQEVSLSEHLETAIKSILDLKKTQKCSLNSNNNNNSSSSIVSAPPAPVPHSTTVPPSAPPTAPHPGRGSDKPLEHSQGPLADTDSVLEAAVNSILEC
nr:PREDICTED: GLTSCR1-like protein isoform X2 [Lepisosteus oculatus]